MRRGHLRKAVHASEPQLFLAQRFRIVVPEGFTFVRGHRRGQAAAEIAYRSVSALRCIKALGPSSPQAGQKDDWFTFEINVRNWLEKNGYEVEHIAGNKHGDGGVDIQARHDEELLLVQCKYWSSDRPIQPNIIRELLGSLSTFPSGALGVIVTSSRLTTGARDLCAQHGLQYIENVNFQSCLNYRLAK
jgi:HJR/Mrr/RecB family endonuclease